MEHPSPADRPCDAFLAGPPCGWRGTPPIVLEVIGIYAEYGQLAADFGGWETAMSSVESEPVRRARLLRLVAVVHRVARAHHEAKAEDDRLLSSARG